MSSQNRDWASSYLELMVGSRVEEGLSLKEKHFPQSFFKYRKLNTLTIESLKHQKIWLSELNALNDPFECSLQFDNDACLRLLYSDKRYLEIVKQNFGLELSDEEVNEIVSSDKPHVTYSKFCHSKNIPFSQSPEEQIAEVQKGQAIILNEASKSIRISCFSEFNNSLLMWSHYADEHKGICIEYDFLDEQEIRVFLQPIIYSTKIYKIPTYEDFTLLQLIGASLNKCKDWEYEGEWRLTILKNTNSFEEKKISVPKPKAIYLGTRFTQNDEELKMEFMKAVNQQNIPVYEMEKHPTEYKLVKKTRLNK
jgi:hypothetical protein